ncbi:penicillin-binding protein activator [Magnetospirillum sulfuroxidans]|uniref:Penicillin-binding protein activator n=1 Tax=Magnetospirillum sulfuroxidans TaxID=611300 RepID=A0ABS5IE99_9PROT|nr:penicillin-binding protein activator [Magnetospirillum sulfuroxidans]MBR9972664.1 penicillin-binding protein activator [Magnetospirillum sulfuroxidans]
MSGTKPAPQSRSEQAVPPADSGQRPQVQLPREPPPPPPVIRSEAPQLVAPPASFQGRDEIRAALLVPLSGPYAAWGQAMSNAAQLALFDVADERLNLIPLDTKGTPEGAVNALTQARTQGADIILGPLFSAEVKAVAPQARLWGVPTISFTTDRAALGQGVYSVGFLPESQVRRVVAHARAQGKEKFALLARSDEYGQAVADAFRIVVPQLGGQVVKVEFYDPQAKDVSNTIKRFTEVESRTRGRSKTSVGPVPPPPFDAAMIADDGTRLRTVSSLVTYYEVDIDKVPLLGTMLWDDPRLSNEPSLQGAWFAAPAAEAYAEFERRYATAFATRPPRAGTLRASLAYDATALAATLVRQNLDYSMATLTNAGGFAGIDGLFRLRTDGTPERGLAVREIAKAGIHDIAPAPTSFAAPAAGM